MYLPGDRRFLNSSIDGPSHLLFKAGWDRVSMDLERNKDPKEAGKGMWNGIFGSFEQNSLLLEAVHKLSMRFTEISVSKSLKNSLFLTLKPTTSASFSEN
jgi:hypothetical protein